MVEKKSIFDFEVCINPLNPMSDQHQFSPGRIDTYTHS